MFFHGPLIGVFGGCVPFLVETTTLIGRPAAIQIDLESRFDVATGRNHRHRENKAPERILWGNTRNATGRPLRWRFDAALQRGSGAKMATSLLWLFTVAGELGAGKEH